MAGQKYTDDPTIASGSIVGTEVFPVAQGGVDKNTTFNNIVSWLNDYFKIIKTGTVSVGTWKSQVVNRVNALASTATLVPDISAYDGYVIGALTVDIALQAPSGGAQEHFQPLYVQITASGGNRNITFTSDYKFTAALTAPVIILSGNTLKMKFLYNKITGNLDCVYKDTFT